MTYAGGTTYSYSSENLLTSSSGGASLTYDPAMRLYQVSGGTAGTQRFAYDGSDLVAEYNSSNAMLRRFVHGPGADEPVVWYEGSGTTDRRFLHADERGTIIAASSSSGAMLFINTYDEYGKPGSSNTGRFQYTGQNYLPELGLYYYKARMYASGLGRFMQNDPSGYQDSLNIYGYSRADPINMIDSTGLSSCPDIAAAHGACEPLDDLRQELLHFGIDASSLSDDDVLSVAAQVLDIGDSLKASNLPPDTTVSLMVTDIKGSGSSSGSTGSKSSGPVVLGFVTVAGGPGHDTWEIRFVVQNGHDGWVVQEVKTSAVMKDGTTISLNPYWEAFHINGGKSDTEDVFERSTSSVSQFTVHAIAYYYENLTLPKSFVPSGSSNTGGALSTLTRPALPPPTSGPLDRDFTSLFHKRGH
jgi:RHS repeat-associated protein